MIDRRTFLAGLAATCTAPVLTGCSTGPLQAVDAGDDELSHVPAVRVTPFSTADPTRLRDFGDAVLAAQLFEPLVRFDSVKKSVVPAAASKFSISDDAQTCTFTLRDNAMFSNGKPVTSHSFAKSWNRLVAIDGRSSEDGKERGAGFGSLLAAVDGYDALRSGNADSLAGLSCPDDKTLLVHLSVPCSDFAVLCSHIALAPVFIDSSDKEYDENDLVGNGPYRLKGSFKPGDPCHLVPSESYNGTQPAGHELVLVADKDANGAYKHFEAGDLSVTQAPVDQLEAIGKSFGVNRETPVAQPGERLVASPTISQVLLACNAESSFTASLEARRALACSIDRDALCEKVLRAAFSPSTRLVPTAIDSDDAFDIPACAFDPDQAASLLETAWPLEENGKRGVKLRLICSNKGIDGKVAEALAADIRALGIDVEVQPYAWSEYQEHVRAREFDLAIVSAAPVCPSYRAALRPLLWSGAVDSTNVAGFISAEIDAALDGLSVAANDSMHARALDVVALAAESMPYIPLAVRNNDVLVDQEVEYLQVDAYGVPQYATLEGEFEQA